MRVRSSSKVWLGVILIVSFFVFAPSKSQAWDGKIWLGKYFSQDWPANPAYTTQAQWATGVNVGHKMKFGDNISVRPYFQTITEMDSRDNAPFDPAGIRYFLGTKATYKKTFIEYQHQCWHPIDSGGEVYEYDLIRFGFTFGK